MPFDLRITNPILHPTVVPQRIVPIRFARAVTGFADRDAPDLDDHGFTAAAAFCAARGPVVTVMGPGGGESGATIRVKVIRDRIEASALLFPVIDDTTIAELVFPAPGAALSPTDVPAAGGAPARPADCVFVRGVSASAADHETTLKIRHGAVDGPVLAEMAIRVSQPIPIRVQAHAVSINGTAPTTTLATIQALFRRVNAIHAQAGIRYAVQGTIMAETVTGFARAGTVTLTAVADQRNVELQTVLRQNAVPGMLNAYFFAHYFDTVSGLLDNVLGIAFSRDDARANPAVPGFPGCQAGITVRDSADPIEAAHTIAHEIGHNLRLQHYALGNGSNGAIGDQREDIWAHRALMYNIVGLVPTAAAGNRYHSSAARIVVGYGNLGSGIPCTGQLITTKNRATPAPGIQQSDQVKVVRAAAKNRSFAPI